MNEYPLGNHPAPNSAWKDFGEDGGLAFERKPTGDVIVYLTRTINRPDEPRGGSMVQVATFPFTAEEWREVERKLQIAK